MILDDPKFLKALEAVQDYEDFTRMVALLAVEYEAQTISSERFAKRVCELIRERFTKYTQPDAAAEQSTKEKS